jgi:uncharacterized protein YlxW (UPF0749 family)
MVNVARKLNLEPENVPECMLVELDEKIESKKLDLEKKKSELDEIIKKTEKKVGTLERKIIRLEKTVDKRLLKKARKIHTLKMRVFNPVEFWRYYGSKGG